MARRLGRFSTHSNQSPDFATESLHGTRPDLTERNFFDSLSQHVRECVLERMEVQKFDTSEMLIRQGDFDVPLLYLTEGSAEVFTVNPQGDRHHIATCGAGDVIGEMSLLTGEPSTANVAALEPVSCQALKPEHFHRLATNHHQICAVLTQVVARRLGGQGRDVLAGKRLAGYEIRGTLGQGGMGIVYRARAETTGEEVALKMMSHRFAYDAKAVAQFQREADVIESFEHVNIVRMRGAFTAFHTQFIVMEYCDGITLGNLIRHAGPLRDDMFRLIFGQLAAAVHHAHAAGIVHRDIKPANIMISQDGTAKLMDFGLAMPFSDEHSIGAGAGTVGYSAPEQLLGNRISREADFWALGCVAHEMLAGDRLFFGKSPAEIIRNYELEDVVQSCRVPAELQSCFAKNPSDRAIDLAGFTGWVGEYENTRADIVARVERAIAELTEPS